MNNNRRARIYILVYFVYSFALAPLVCPIKAASEFPPRKLFYIKTSTIGLSMFSHEQSEERAVLVLAPRRANITISTLR